LQTVQSFSSSNIPANSGGVGGVGGVGGAFVFGQFKETSR
jgi:hypothetical protein